MVDEERKVQKKLEKELENKEDFEKMLRGVEEYLGELE